MLIYQKPFLEKEIARQQNDTKYEERGREACFYTTYQLGSSI